MEVLAYLKKDFMNKLGRSHETESKIETICNNKFNLQNKIKGQLVKGPPYINSVIREFVKHYVAARSY